MPHLHSTDAPCHCQSEAAATVAASGKKSKSRTDIPTYAQCCGRFIEHPDAAAPSAEHLMRSRYSAFVLGRETYLLATWHPSTRPAALEFDPATQWLGLQVRDHQCIDATHSEVEFVARYRLHGRATRLHERSRFVLEAGRWLYVDGDQR